MEEINFMKKEKVAGRDLVDLVLSWSIDQVLNQNLYRGQVNKIPETFMSTSQYMKAFISPLIEETHAELLSSAQLLPQAPACEVSIVGPCNDYKPPNDLFYKVSLTRAETRNRALNYEPVVGDLIVLSDVRPTCVDDLKRNYVTAFFYKSAGGTSGVISMLSSKPIEEGFIKNRQMPSTVEQAVQTNNGRRKLFAVYLINMTTNIRIWNALNSKLEGKNMSLIEKVLKANCLENEACSICAMKERNSIPSSKIMENLQSFKLNKSQEEAVLCCINAGVCSHQKTVKLIWGPPGTGKTKTVGILLCALFQMKCRTLTCAPTNIAVVEVAARVRKSLVEIVGCETYGVGDIVLFGNQERMKIDEQNDVLDVFLDFRVETLKQCFSLWSNCLTSMINLLENPEELHCFYLLENLLKKKDKEENIDEPENDIKCSNDHRINDKNKGHIPKKNKKARSKKKEVEVKVEDDHSKNSANSEEESESLTLEEFVQKRFKFINEKLEFCITSLYTHLPTSCIPLKVVKDMIKAIKLLKSLEAWLFSANFVDGGLKEILVECENVLNKTRKECVNTLKMLPQEFPGQNLNNEMEIRKFCLSNACLLFCTASSSIRLHAKNIAKLQCVVIDEAAQLKECESSIPLQLNRLRHAILVGDERQLSAMVNSPISKEAGFGRSLFERMVNLEYGRHLLDVQYRMHPSISKFPNAEFYGNRISDAENVIENSHNRRFLKSQMYGNYSFINIACGQEEFDNSRSLRNVVEVAAVADIVSRLFNVFTQTKKRVSIGIITPYKAQVCAIQEKIAKRRCANSDADFTVNVRSVDGFQGGEEDVIIISTVRCNRKGVVGFLSDKQRANVALTRARYCLWILGNEETLVKSGSIWRNIVEDAKGRGCFYDASADKSLAKAISLALLQLDQLDLDALLTMDKARWKVCLTDEFRASMKRMKNLGTRQEVISLLGKLSSGWRQSKKKKKAIENDGLCWQVIEQYKVNEKLFMVWSVDTVLESSFEVQVLKIWDVLTASQIPKMAKRFDQVIRNYAVNKMDRCQYKSMKGNLVVPMKWEIDASVLTSQGLSIQPMNASFLTSQDLNIQPVSVQPISVGVDSSTNKLEDHEEETDDHKKEMDASFLSSQDLNSSPNQDNIKPPKQNNVDLIFEMEKGVLQAPKVAELPEFHVGSGHNDRVTGLTQEHLNLQTHLQRHPIRDQEQHQAAMYKKSFDENFVPGGVSAAYGGSGDYYVQKLSEKTVPPLTIPQQVSAPPGYSPEKQVASGFHAPMTAYMIPATHGSVYHHNVNPVVRPVTGQSGPGYYVQRMGGLGGAVGVDSSTNKQQDYKKGEDASSAEDNNKTTNCTIL